MVLIDEIERLASAPAPDVAVGDEGRRVLAKGGASPATSGRGRAPDVGLHHLAAWNDTRTDYPRDATLPELFEAVVAEAPEAIAVVFEGRTLTYGELDRHATRLAGALQRAGVGLGVPVALFAERSPALLIGLLATLKAGGIHVPLDPRYPVERLRQMTQTLGTKVLLERRGGAVTSWFEGQTIVLDDEGRFEAEKGDVQPLASFRSCAAAPAYVMFTSGSTGRPKGVVVPHRGVVRLVVNTNYTSFDRTDRVMHTANPCFDLSMFEIWGALLHGAQLVILPEGRLLSAGAFVEAVRAADVSVLFLTTALFHHFADTAPEAFQGVQTVLVGGDVLDPKWAHDVLRRAGVKHLVNGYGPTEATGFSTAYRVRDLPEETPAVPIGTPIANSRAYVLDEALQPVPVGVSGELYVAGDGLSQGYWNESQLTASRFVPDPFAVEPGAVMYRTGDGARHRADGTLEFLGRLDRQVKIRGYRIEPAEIEAVLASSSLVKEAVVVVQEDGRGDKRLVAYVVAQTDATTLRAYLAARLPHQAIPSAFVLLPGLPLTPNGKVDRAALPPPGRLETRSPSDELEPPRTPTEQHLAWIWREVLGVDEVFRSDSFFALGGNSLLLARLLLRVQQEQSVHLSAESLFSSATLAEFAQRVDEAVGSHGTPVVTTTVQHLTTDSTLDPSIRPSPDAAPPATQLRHLLLTGATGFMGAFLLRDLLSRTDAQIHCLVRAADTAHGLRRILEMVRRYTSWTPEDVSRIVPIPGDLARARLGLSDEQLAFLTENVDAIYHSGADVNYVNPYFSHRDANIGGTREILRMACAHKLKPVHFVSSTAVYGQIGYYVTTDLLHEDEGLEFSRPYMGTDMGYSQSKWVAEKLVTTARERGLPVNIYRPGFLMGDSVLGNSNTNDFITRLVKGCVQLGCCPDMENHRKIFTAVDFVSAALAEISLDPTARGGVYHLVPSPKDDLSLNGFFDLLIESGYPLERVTYGEWVDRLRRAAETSSDNVLFPLLPLLSEPVYKGLTRWELCVRMPPFDDTNTRRALAGSGISCPPLGKKLMDVYLGWMHRTGYLAPPPQQAAVAAPTPTTEVAASV
ncbi:amino acid adenylation domain-containing protein [Chondromyces crocatus]|uniref:Nonribosomal peptide synthase n=1 Tax=Chondromyces crocatus TaxID=52 RepID=A0A0K1EQM7_CHOCO|nr:amino acid adenylation domain-containing protein [Chondromyces crocatus]AKT42957.1 nonribosomal peptide synthase [Chondromyces crocatus]